MRARLYSLHAAFYFIAGSLFAQSEVDTTKANIIFKEAQDLLFAGKYLKAADKYTIAAGIYKNAESWEDHVIALNRKADCHWRIGRFPEATSIIQEAIKTGKTYLSEDNLKLSDCYISLGIISAITEKFDAAEENYKIALEIKGKQLGYDHIEVAQIYNNIGILLAQLANTREAIANHEKALAIRRKHHGEVHNELYSSYDNLAFCYVLDQDINKALEYSLRAVSIGEEVHGKEHPRMSPGYNTLAMTYALNKDYDKSLETYFNALNIRNKIGHKLGAAVIMANIGRLYMKKGEYDKALDYMNRQLDLYFETIGGGNARIGNTYNNIGQVYTLLGEYEEAKSYHLKAIEVFQGLSKFDHPSLAFSYNLLGESLNGLGDYSSLDYFQYALISNVPAFSDSSLHSNPSSIDYRNLTTLLKSLVLKAETLHKRYLETGEIKDLKSALETYQVCDRVVDRNRQIRLRYEDKLIFSKSAKEVYEGAVEVSMDVDELNDGSTGIEEAFYFAEKSKSSILYENISTSQAKRFSGLPDSLLIYEQELKAAQSFAQSQIQRFQGSDTTRLRISEAEMFDINRRLDSIANFFENNYPNYYQLKYQNRTISIQEIQSNLSGNQVLLEYFENDGTLYIFVISQESFWVESIRDINNLDALLDQYIDSFSTQSNFSEDFSVFAEVSGSLYDLLIAPIKNKIPIGTNQLIIVPNEQLSYVPWGLFVQAPTSRWPGEDFKSLNYLLRDFSISYAYSASLMFQELYDSPKAPETMLGFAPSYEQQNEKAYSSLGVQFRDEFRPLKWNTDETNAVGKLFDGNVLAGPAATESSFKEGAGDHRILHLAMHAFVDNKDPMLSKLVFSQSTDSIEDGMLHAYELFNMDLSAEMVVLSACNTGIGKIEEGEGIMSLGRAFSYAGCPSLVTSHWSVDDESTSRLMTNFYEHIAKGIPKTDALRRAKLEFLENTSGAKTHPFFWGGFVLVGDISPIEKGRSNFWIIIYALGGIVIISVVAARRKRKSPK